MAIVRQGMTKDEVCRCRCSGVSLRIENDSGALNFLQLQFLLMKSMLLRILDVIVSEEAVGSSM